MPVPQLLLQQLKIACSQSTAYRTVIFLFAANVKIAGYVSPFSQLEVHISCQPWNTNDSSTSTLMSRIIVIDPTSQVIDVTRLRIAYCLLIVVLV